MYTSPLIHILSQLFGELVEEHDDQNIVRDVEQDEDKEDESVPASAERGEPRGRKRAGRRLRRGRPRQQRTARVGSGHRDSPPLQIHFL